MLSYELQKDGVTIIALHPGRVDTDMGNAYKGTAVAPFITPSQSVADQLKLYDRLSLQDSGKFFSYTGDVLKW